MADAASSALQEVTRQLNFSGSLPSVSQAKAAVTAAEGNAREALKAAGKLPGAIKSALLGLTFTEASATKALHANLSDLSLARKRLTGPDASAVPAKVWSEAHKSILGTYQESFTVKETAAYATGISFAHEIADLQRNLKEAVPIAKAVLKATQKAVSGVVGAASEIAGGAIWAILKPLLPIIIVIGILLYVVSRTSAGKTAIGIGKARVGL